MTTKLSGSIRRGPTLRTDKYLPAVIRRQRTNKSLKSEQTKEQLEEDIICIPVDDDNQTIEEDEEKKIGMFDEKLILQDGDQPQTKKNRWSFLHQEQINLSNLDKRETREPGFHQVEAQYSIVLHFRQLRGNQYFVLDYNTADEFCKKLNLTSQEKIQFNGVRDTDSLTEFLYRTNREFSIKVHHKNYKYQPSSNSNIIELNVNLFIEFKPKRLESTFLSLQDSKRPFYQHPEPDLSADIGEEKAASWLELFYDLFYVATLSQFTHSHHITDWDSLWLYTQWFIITWWAWCASSLYTARFDTDDVVHHVYKLVEMCAVIGMAGSSEYFLNSSGYVYGYITLKAVLVVEYFVVFVVAILAKSKSRVALGFYVGANLLSIALWASSLCILEKESHRILWYLGVLSEILVNVIVRRDKRLSWAASNLAERLGLLSLIVLGENLMGLVTLVSLEGNSVAIVIPNFIAVVIIFGYFFMYFEDFNKDIFLHNAYHQTWVYVHFPLHLCQVAFGISLIDILKIYRYQLIRDHKLPEDEIIDSLNEKKTNETSIRHPNAHPNNTETSSTGNNTYHNTSTESHQKESSDTNHESASHDIHKIKRDVFEILNLTTIDQPPSLKLVFEKSQPSQLDWLAWSRALLSSVFFGSMQFLDSGDENRLWRRSDLSLSGAVDTIHVEEMKEEFTENMTASENGFVYKTFLIFAGLLLVINSVIKALNIKASDKYSRWIILARIINAIILWSMCALSFANLDAIVLLYSLLGSLLFQAFIDLLD